MMTAEQRLLPPGGQADPDGEEAGARHQQTLRQLHLLAAHGGRWEPRALQRTDSPRMQPRGSAWIAVHPSPNGLIYDGLEGAIAWADRRDREGAEIFVGYPRATPGGRHNADVVAVACCFIAARRLSATSSRKPCSSASGLSGS
jgi:hypothetical protein